MLRARRRPAPPGLFLSQDKLSPPLPSQPLAASILPSVSVIFEFLSISYNRRGQNLSFCDWLVSGAWFQRPPRRSGRGVLPLQAEQQSAVRAASLLSAARGAGPPCYPRCEGRGLPAIRPSVHQGALVSLPRFSGGEHRCANISSKPCFQFVSVCTQKWECWITWYLCFVSFLGTAILVPTAALPL